MADDWQAGDEGVCIRSSEWTPINGAEPIIGPAKGDYIKVTDVEPDPEKQCCGAPFLELSKWPDIMWCSTAFRKLRPDNQPSADGEALAASIRRMGEKVSA